MDGKDETLRINDLQKLAITVRPFILLLHQSSEIHGAAPLVRDTKRALRVIDAILGNGVLAATRRKSSRRRIDEQVRDFQQLLLDDKLG